MRLHGIIWTYQNLWIPQDPLSPLFRRSRKCGFLEICVNIVQDLFLQNLEATATFRDASDAGRRVTQN